MNKSTNELRDLAIVVLLWVGIMAMLSALSLLLLAIGEISWQVCVGSNGILALLTGIACAQKASNLTQAEWRENQANLTGQLAESE